MLSTLRQGPTIAFVDDPVNMAAVIKAAFPSIQHVKCDVVHAMFRVDRTVPPKHTGRG